MRLRIARCGAGLAAVGIAVVVAGTFLPWLRSGTVLRDSYQAVGAVRTLLVSGPMSTLLTAWLFVIPVCGVCVALYALRLRRVSAMFACVVSLVVGTAAVLVTVQGSDPGALIGVSMAGPVVTLAGAVAALVGSTAVLARPGRAGGQLGGNAS